MATLETAFDDEDRREQEEYEEDSDRYWPSLNPKNTEFQERAEPTSLADRDPRVREAGLATYLTQGMQEANLRPQKQLDKWEKATVAAKKFSWLYGSSQATEMNAARVRTTNDVVDDETLVEGLPDAQHGIVYQERDKFGHVAALAKRDQLRDVLANNSQFNAMDGWEQFLYGAGAVIADPVNLTGLGALAKVEQGASAAFKGAQTASIINSGVSGGRAWLASPLVANSAKLAGYASLGAAEGAIINAPLMNQDPTYTATDYMYDIAFDAGFGTVIGGGIMVLNRPKVLTHKEELDASFRKLQEDLQRKADPIDENTEQVLKPLAGWLKNNHRWNSLGRRLQGIKDGQTKAEVEQLQTQMRSDLWSDMSKDTNLAAAADRVGEKLRAAEVALRTSTSQVDELTSTSNELETVAAQLKTQREALMTPEIKVATARAEELKALYEERKGNPEAVAALRKEAADLKRAILAHRANTDTPEIKELEEYRESLSTKKKTLDEVRETNLQPLKELFKEREGLIKEFNSLSGKGNVIPPKAEDLAPLEKAVDDAFDLIKSNDTAETRKALSDAKAALRDAQIEKAMPVSNNVAVDANEVRRREIRKRLDMLEDMRRDLVEKAKPAPSKRYATMADVMSIDKKMFDNVALTLQGRYKKNSPMYVLVNRHQKMLRDIEKAARALDIEIGKTSEDDVVTMDQLLLQKARMTEESKELGKLSADIVRLLSVTPEGEVPEWLENAVREATNVQSHFTHTNVFAGILEDGTSNPEKLLSDYVDQLRKMDIWEGYDVQPVSTADFYRENSEWLNPELDERYAESGEIDYMQVYMSPELSFLRDVVRLNEFVKNKPELYGLVEEVNGYVMTRLAQKEVANSRVLSQGEMELISEEIKATLRDWGYIRGTQDYVDKFTELYQGALDQARQDSAMPEWADSRESWGKSVRMTPDDILRQVRREGYVSGTQEFKDRFRELSKSGERIAVPREANLMGKRKSFVIGTERTDVLDRDEINASDTIYSGGADDFEGVRDAPASNQVKARTLDLVVDEPDAGLLPKHVTTIRNKSVYDEPTLENIKRMREVIRTRATSQAERLQAKAAITEADMLVRMEKIIKALGKDKAEVIRRAVNSKNFSNIVDVIRASEMVARQEAQKLVDKPKPVEAKTESKSETKAEPKKEPTFKEQVAEIPPAPLTEERIELLNPKIEQKEPVSKVEIAAIERDVLRGVEETERDALETVARVLTDHVGSGQDDAYKEAMKPKGWLDSIGRLATKWTKDLGEVFLSSDLLALRYVGATLVETGAGFGGGARRKATAALIRDTEYKQSVAPMVMGYRDNLEKFAHAQGASAAGKLYALESAGVNSGITEKFNRAVFKEIEMRKQGGSPIRNKEAGVADFVDVWEQYMSKNHDKLVSANIKGFTKERKVAHYMPHVWKPHKLQAAIKEHGLEKVFNVLKMGYMTSSQAGKLALSEAEASTQAWDLIKWIEGQGDLDKQAALSDDPYLPVMDSRARARMEINTLEEIDGLSVMDLLETDVIGNGVRYSNRLAGWLGLSKATNGQINSHHTIDALRRTIKQEAEDKKLPIEKINKSVQLFDDTIEMLFGRPTRGGLAPELRMIKDMTALTRMGGLGTAQLIETGQVLARSTLNLFSDPSTIKKVLKAGGTNANENDLLKEVQTLTGIRDDLEFLERQSIHLDQEDLANVGNVRKASLWLADKATFGSLKAPAGRLLGKTTGFNMVRRAQTRMNQLSFVMDVARHFKDGTGKMGNARMADLGLTDPTGRDVELEEVFSKYVEYDKEGNVTKLNTEKWSEQARDKFNLAMIRDDAQNIQRTHVGELPPWMNSPLMAMVMQFREMPMVAMNKSLRRNMAFADKEAVVGFMLNAAFAGIVRWSKFAALGYAAAKITGTEWVEPNQEKMDTAKYITQFGLYADLYDLILDSRKATEEGDVDKVLNNIPVLGLMQDYSDATGITEEQRRTQLDSVQGLTPLGNTAYGDVIYMWLNEQFGE